MSFVVAAKWVARTGNEDTVRGAIEELASLSRAEPGCIEYHAQQGIDEPTVFLLYEVYASSTAYEQHLETEHFRRYAVELGIPLLERREREFYETFADRNASG